MGAGYSRMNDLTIIQTTQVRKKKQQEVQVGAKWQLLQSVCHNRPVV